MAEDSGRSNPIKGVVEGVKGVAKQAVGAVAGQKYLVREGKAQAAQASGYIPGAHARLYRSDAERCEEFVTWLHTYNHHRGHTALGGQPPAARVPNLSGQYS